MRLTPGRQVFGLEPTVLRTGVQKLLDRCDPDHPQFKPADLVAALGCPRTAAELLPQLQAAGMVSAANEPGVFKAELPLIRIGAAAINHGIPRSEADKLIALLLQKVQEIEANPHIYWHRVSKLAVFGSYLTDAPVLGDIDVAFDVERVVRRADVERDGTCVYDFFAQSSRRLAKTKVALRLRRPEKMSLHRYDELKSLGTPYRDLI